MSGCHMSPWVDSNRRGARLSCVTALSNLFSLTVTPPPHPTRPLHPHRLATFTLLCMWGGLDACAGCGLKDRPGSGPRGNGIAQGIYFHPCMSTTPNPLLSLPSISRARPVYGFVHLSVTAAAFLRVTGPTAVVCRHPGWFPLHRCWSWARAAHTHRQGCQCQTWRATHRWESKTFTRKTLFLLWRRTFSVRRQEWERFAVLFPVHQSPESAYAVGWCSASSCAIPQCKLHEVNSLYVPFLCVTHKDKCSVCSERWEPAASGSLPQDRQKNTSRKRKGSDSCWGKMHQSAWLKAIISRRSVWNVEEWSLWRNRIIYLFMFVVLIFPQMSRFSQRLMSVHGYTSFVVCQWSCVQWRFKKLKTTQATIKDFLLAS